MKIFVLPGNPPSKHHYTLWAKELKTQFPSVDFHYIEYPLPKPNLLPQENLNFMVSEVAKKLKALGINDRSILIGHSFGGYFLNRLSDFFNVNSIYIFPFVGAPNLKGKLTLDLAHYFKPLLRLPIGLKAFYKIVCLSMPEVKHISLNEFGRGMVTASVEKKVLRDVLAPFSQNIHKNSLLIFNQRDSWSNMDTTKAFKERMPAIETSITHDFVLYPQDRKKMQNLLAPYIQSHFDLSAKV